MTEQPQRKLRILALHSFRTSAETFKEQVTLGFYIPLVCIACWQGRALLVVLTKGLT